MPKSFGDYALAAQMRDAIEVICVRVIERMRPRQQYAEVKSIDRTSRRCSVLFRGDNQTISIPMGTIQPAVVGQIVRIVGTPDDRYIADVIGPGGAYFDTDPRVTAPPASTTKQVGVQTFTRSGVLAVAAGVTRFTWPFNATILGVSASVNGAPSGSSIIVDVNRNGITIFTNQANRPTIPAQLNYTREIDPEVADMSIGDYLTIDIDQVGSTVPGTGLTVVVRYQNDDS